MPATLTPDEIKALMSAIQDGKVNTERTRLAASNSSSFFRTAALMRSMPSLPRNSSSERSEK